MELLLFSNSTVSSMPSTDLKSHPPHYMLIAIGLHMVGWPRIMLSQLFQVMSCRNITCKLLSSLKLVLMLSLSGMKSQFQMLLLQLLQLLRTNLLHALNVCLKRVPGLLQQVKQRQENTFVSWLSLVQENINAMLRLLQHHHHHQHHQYHHQHHQYHHHQHHHWEDCLKEKLNQSQLHKKEEDFYKLWPLVISQTNWISPRMLMAVTFSMTLSLHAHKILHPHWQVLFIQLLTLPVALFNVSLLECG